MLRNIFTFKRLFDFTGRATRREYFLLLGTVIVAWISVTMLEGILAGTANEATPGAPSIVFMLVYTVLGIGSLIVLLAALVRRAHDHDKSGVVILLNLIPLVGWIFWLILTLTPGNPYENTYGPDPREMDPLHSDHLQDVFS